MLLRTLRDTLLCEDIFGALRTLLCEDVAARYAAADAARMLAVRVLAARYAAAQ